MSIYIRLYSTPNSLICYLFLFFLKNLFEFLVDPYLRATVKRLSHLKRNKRKGCLYRSIHAVVTPKEKGILVIN